MLHNRRTARPCTAKSGRTMDCINEHEEDNDDQKSAKRTKSESASNPEALYRPKRFHPARPGGSLQVSKGLMTSSR